MAEPKIVDAVATAPARANVSQQTVPVKIDGSALTEMMSKIAASQQQQQQINPADYVAAAGSRMKDMYARYETLRKIGGVLHGKAFNDPVPAELEIENVTINFRLAGATETSSAKIFNIACVGDLAQLLSTEMGTIILALQQEAKALSELSKSTENMTQKAREAWESSNKDRKIVMTTTPPTQESTSGEVATPNEN